MNDLNMNPAGWLAVIKLLKSNEPSVRLVNLLTNPANRTLAIDADLIHVNYEPLAHMLAEYNADRILSRYNFIDDEEMYTSHITVEALWDILSMKNADKIIPNDSLDIISMDILMTKNAFMDLLSCPNEDLGKWCNRTGNMWYPIEHLLELLNNTKFSDWTL